MPDQKRKFGLSDCTTERLDGILRDSMRRGGIDVLAPRNETEKRPLNFDHVRIGGVRMPVTGEEKP